MKVLAAVIIPPHLNASGAANAAKHLSASLAEYCDIDLAILSSQEKSGNLGKAVLLERKSSNILSFTKGLLPNKFRTLFYKADIPSLIERGNYDLIHLHNVIPALEAKRVAQTCVQQKIPYVVSTHGFFEITSGGTAYVLKHLHEKLAWKYFLEKPFNYVIAHAHKILALSPLEYPLLNNLGIRNENIEIVTNGVSQEFYTENHLEQMKSIAERWSLPPDKTKIPVSIFLGNHTKNKGVEILLEAFSLIKKPFILIICGKKRNNINYTKYASNLSSEQKIIFTDWISYEDVVSLFHYADLFVYPTLSDTLPLVVLEAMAAGLPVLSTKVGGIPYQVESGCGVLVEPGNPQAIAEAFEQMTQDKSRSIAMGRNAKQVVKSKFSWENSAQKACVTYHQILAESKVEAPETALAVNF